MIARFWDVDEGKVTLGGVNVKDYSMNSLMNNFSFVFQTVYLFADTIENNIKFGRQDATHEEVVAAAKKACCHEFISQLPNGYDTVIGEGFIAFRRPEAAHFYSTCYYEGCASRHIRRGNSQR